MCKYDNNVNDSMFDGVIVDDKIEGVGEGWTVECSPVASVERGNRDGRLAAGTHRQWRHACVSSEVDFENICRQRQLYVPGNLQHC